MLLRVTRCRSFEPQHRLPQAPYNQTTAKRQLILFVFPGNDSRHRHNMTSRLQLRQPTSRDIPKLSRPSILRTNAAAAQGISGHRHRALKGDWLIGGIVVSTTVLNGALLRQNQGETEHCLSTLCLPARQQRHRIRPTH